MLMTILEMTKKEEKEDRKMTMQGETIYVQLAVRLTFLTPPFIHI
jgi:hypothetical protein